MSLRVSAVLIEAAKELNNNRSALFQALLAPGVAIVALNVLHARMNAAMPAMLSLSLVGLWFQSLFAVSCHRIILLGQGQLPNRWGLYATAPVWRFFGVMLAVLAFFTIIFMIVFAFVFPFLSTVPSSMHAVAGTVLITVGAIAFFVAFARIVLLFPAIAIDSGQTMSDVFDLTRPCWIRLALLVGIPAIVTSLISFPLTRLAQQADTIVPALIQSSLGCVIGAYCVATISCAYRAIDEDGVTASMTESEELV
jgi:hypothetical protein